MFTEYLATWRNNHPNPVLEELVFLDQTGKEMEYSAIRKIIDRAKVHAGISKRVHPHLFRSSRITHMVVSGFNESVIKTSMWNNLGTSMFQTYVKLDKSNIDAEFLKQAGVEVPEEERQVPMKAVTCPVCHMICPPTSHFCSKCGNALDPTEQKTIDETVIKILQDPELLKLYTELSQKINKPGTAIPYEAHPESLDQT
jgi:hypothetical protein